MSLRVLPVGAFVHVLREALETDPLSSDLWLEGEISDFSRSVAGHTYFTLRDEDGCLKCVLFRNESLRQHQPPTLGAQIAVHGGLSLYPRSGSLQLVVDLVRPAGLGAAMLELEYLRQRLEAEGLFDPSRKRLLPAWPQTIGVVTSEYGAAWHDIQSVMRRRFPLATLVLAPALVQGDGAAVSIVAAIEAVQRDDRVQLVIVARGGGGADDLAAFNDERVARAVFGCRVPVIVGIGHATDRTLIEEVADACAPTPSAAAEMSVPSLLELRERLEDLQARLSWSRVAWRQDAVATMRAAVRRLMAASPKGAVRRAEATLDVRSSRLRGTMAGRLENRERELVAASSLLNALEPAAVLRRGYAALHDADDGQPVFSMTQVRHGTGILAILEDGRFVSIVDRADIPSRGRLGAL